MVGTSPCTLAMRASSAVPSTHSIPTVFASAIASSVNVPQLTTMPPVARSVTMTECRLRMMSTRIR